MTPAAIVEKANAVIAKYTDNPGRIQEIVQWASSNYLGPRPIFAAFSREEPCLSQSRSARRLRFADQGQLEPGAGHLVAGQNLYRRPGGARAAGPFLYRRER